MPPTLKLSLAKKAGVVLLFISVVTCSDQNTVPYATGLSWYPRPQIRILCNLNDDNYHRLQFYTTINHGCIFRPNMNTHTGRTWTAVPVDHEHRFRIDREHFLGYFRNGCPQCRNEYSRWIGI